MPSKVIFTDNQINELKQLVESGTRQTDIAKHFDVTDDTIRKICRENDIQIRQPHKCVCVICTHFQCHDLFSEGRYII